MHRISTCTAELAHALLQYRVGGGTPKGRCGRRRSRPFAISWLNMMPTGTGTLNKETYNKMHHNIKSNSKAMHQATRSICSGRKSPTGTLDTTNCSYDMHCNEPADNTHAHINTCGCSLLLDQLAAAHGNLDIVLENHASAQHD